MKYWEFIIVYYPTYRKVEKQKKKSNHFNVVDCMKYNTSLKALSFFLSLPPCLTPQVHVHDHSFIHSSWFFFIPLWKDCNFLNILKLFIFEISVTLENTYFCLSHTHTHTISLYRCHYHGNPTLLLSLSSLSSSS